MLFGLFVVGMLFAPLTELAQLQTILQRFFILGAEVVHALACGAL